MKLGGVGWSWMEIGARFSNTRIFIYKTCLKDIRLRHILSDTGFCQFPLMIVCTVAVCNKRRIL